MASALWGRAAVDAGAGMAIAGLAMHFTVALTATLVFFALSRRLVVLRTAPLWIVGPLYGVIVFCAMKLRHPPCAVVATQSLPAHAATMAGPNGLAAASHPHGLRRHANRLGRTARRITAYRDDRENLRIVCLCLPPDHQSLTRCSPDAQD